MKTIAAGVLGVLLVLAGQSTETGPLSLAAPPEITEPAVSSPALHPNVATDLPAADLSAADLTDVVQQYCVRCHNERRLIGNMSLEQFRVEAAYEFARTPGVATAETAEKMIVKLRARMMPPPGARRPAGDTLLSLVQALESVVDEAAAANPNPGTRSFQRLNRPEYESSIRAVMGLQVDAARWLPLDAKSANFDNIADAQLLSPALMDAYMSAAAEISRLAIGYQNTTPSETQYLVAQWNSQYDRVEGAPFGSRGGTSVVHHFPADGEYTFRVSFHVVDTGTIYGDGNSGLHSADSQEQVEISIDGEPVALMELDRWMNEEDPNGANMRTEPIFIRSGEHRVTAAFVRKYEGVVADVLSPHDWSIPTTSLAGNYGIQALPHMRDFVVGGPYNASGVSDTPVRQGIFTCRPTSPDEGPPCAEQIISDLADKAFRRPVETEELEALLSFYEEGVERGGFEEGIRSALEAILSSPQFVFRIEQAAADAGDDRSYRLGDFALASRLSYFLWATPPDEELVSLAREGRLSDPQVLEAQTERMLADPRSEALATRFASQWLRLGDIDGVHPTVRIYPDFDEQLKSAMRRETELFFYGLVKEDRNVLELLTADYTYVNERLAKHYGIPGVAGREFRRMPYADDTRRGILGHASILTGTSMPARTSPVLRGKWLMEVILGTPPPPPPPGVPPLEETEGISETGAPLTTRQRMEKHRESPVCNACHKFMDPFGLALDNFDVVGQWRIRENGMPLDTRGELYDGTPINSVDDLQSALLGLSTPILRNFTVNLMAYALGRRVEYYDMPTVRQIVASAEESGYRISSFVMGVAKSDAFQKRKPIVVSDGSEDLNQR